MRRAAGLLLLVLLAAPAAADAQVSDSRYRGVTGQGRDVRFSLSDTGAPQSVTVQWDAPCRRGTRFAVQDTVFVPRVEEPPPGILDGVGRYRVAERRGRIAKVVVVMQGRVRGDPARPATLRWSGTLRVRATMRRHGRLEDRCSLRTRWRAGPEGIGVGVWEEVAAGFERLPEPHVRRRDSGSAVVTASGMRHEVSVRAWEPSAGADGRPDEPWGVTFKAPALNRLEPGRTYVVREDDPEGAAEMDFTWGPAFTNFCFDDVLSFTVEHIAFDDLKRLSALRVRFERECRRSSGEPAGTVRGTIEWRATA